MLHRPDFIIIGAMKCATTTLYDQLKRQPGIFMPEFKEPNFFSDDERFAHGTEWYSALFDDAAVGDILGEASTHYSKQPSYPETLGRLQQMLDSPRFVYVMRHPVERLVSHYIHEWTQGNISVDIDHALDTHPELIAYSGYAYQLQPYIQRYGRESLLPVFFERLKKRPQQELERVCRFIDYRQQPHWHNDRSPSNISKDRIRKFPLYNVLIESPPARFLRRSLIPGSVRTMVKRRFQMRGRPVLSQESLHKLTHIFDADLAELGDWLGVKLNCQNYPTVVAREQLEWQSELNIDA